MPLTIDDKLLDQMKKICLEFPNKVSFSILIGAIEDDLNLCTLFTAVHFIRDHTEKKEAITVFPEELNQFIALKYSLPYNLNIIGLCFYSDKEITSYTLQALTKSVTSIPSLKYCFRIGKEEIECFQLSIEKIIKIEFKQTSYIPSNLLHFIHTMELETNIEILDNVSELKKTLYANIDLLWQKIVYNKNAALTLNDLQKAKSPLDRIIEITIPAVEMNLKSKTIEGKVFLALDLHINFFITESLRNKKLSEVKSILNEAIKQDLFVKLQRAIYDKNIKKLITPRKIPMKFFGIELNGYLSKENPSKYEYDLCTSLISHAEIMAALGANLPARIFLHDLNEYFIIIDNKEKQIQITELILKLS